jgi:hypothetical protein
MPEAITVVREKIHEFLGRNLLLDQKILQEVRGNLPVLNAEQIHRVYDILKIVDDRQTQGLVKKLKTEPYFFKKLEYLIYRAMYQEHLEAEKSIREQADRDLIADLEALSVE